MVPIVFLENLPGFISLVHRLPFRITGQRQRIKRKKSGFSSFLKKLAYGLGSSL